MISVIVPAYNTEKTLERAVCSILRNRVENTEIEVIIVDDGSTDDTPKICDRLARNENVRVFHTENRGSSAARNLGLQASLGEYIGFVDSDDWVEHDMYKTLLETMLEQQADLVACGVIQETVYGAFPDSGNGSVHIFEGTSIYQALFISSDVRGYLWNKLYSRKLITCRMDETIAQCEDLLFNAMYCANVVKTACIRKPLYHYVRRDINTGFAYTQRDLSLMAAYEKLLAVYQVKAPMYAYLPAQNALSTFLYFRACAKLMREKDQKQLMLFKQGIQTHWASVFLSKQVSLKRKVNFCITFLFPVSTLRVKQKILAYNHERGIWEA